MTPLRTEDLVIELGTVYGCTIDGGTTSLTAASAAFSPSDVGNTVTIIGAGADYGDPFDASLFKTTITAYTSAYAVTLASPAVTSVAPNNNLTVYRPLRRSVLTRSPINFSRSLSTGKGELSFSVWSPDGSLQPQQGQPVWLHHLFLGDLFGGYINVIDPRNEPGDKNHGIETACACVDWSGVFTRRLVGSYNSSYAGKTLKELGEAIVYNHGGSEGFVVDAVTGPVIDAVSYDYSTNVADALTDACTRASVYPNAFWWFVSPWKVVKIVAKDTLTAPFNLADSDSSAKNHWLAQFNVEATGEKRANRVFATGTELGAAVTETKPGDGTKRSFDASTAIYLEPTITRNGNPQSVGVKGIDAGKDWYWTSGNAAVEQDSAGTTLSNVETLEIEYQPSSAVSAFYQYDAGVDAAAAQEGGTGFHDMLIEIGTAQSLGGVAAIAEATAKNMSDVPRSIEGRTYDGGLDVAQRITVELSSLGIPASYFLIDEITLDCTDNLMQWVVHMVSGPLLGDWRNAFLNSLGGSSMGGGGATAGPPGPPGPPGTGTGTPAPSVTATGDITGYAIENNTTYPIFGGDVALPYADADYAHLKHLVIYLVDSDGVETELVRYESDNFPLSGPLTYGAWNPVARVTDAAQPGWGLRFRVYNESNSPTEPPFDVTGISISKGMVDSVSFEEVSTRYVPIKDPTRLQVLHLEISPEFLDAVAPQFSTYGVSEDDGATFVMIGWSSDAVIATERLVPGTDSYWKVCAVAGTRQYDPSVRLSAVDLAAKYPDVRISDRVLIGGIAAPLPGQITDFAASAIVRTSDPSSGDLRWSTVFSWTDPSNSIDWLTKIYVRVVDHLGSPMPNDQWIEGYRLGQWDEWGELEVIPGKVRYSVPFVGGYVPDGPYSDYHYLQCQCVAVSRRSASRYDWAGTDTISSTAQGSPLTIDFGALPDGQIPADRITGTMAGDHVDSIGGPSNADLVFACPIVNGAITPEGQNTYAWNGEIVTPASDVTCVGYEITAQYDGDAEGGAFCTLKDSQTTFHNGDYLRPANDVGITFRCYPISRDGMRGSPVAYSDVVTATPISAGACLANGITDAQFVSHGGSLFTYTLANPGTWSFDFYKVQWTQPSKVTDGNLWFTILSEQKGAVIGGVWTPAPDSEGRDEDPYGNYPGRKVAQSPQLQGIPPAATALITISGKDPATRSIPLDKNLDGSTNLYRTYRYWLTNVSILGRNPSGASGVYQLQTSAWGGADHVDLTPATQAAALNLLLTDPNSLAGSNIGGGGGVTPFVKLSGPLYNDVANNLNIRIASDFVVTMVGGVPTLSQNVVDLAKSVNFDLGEFQKVGGAFVMKALAINKLIAGDALFAGTATFAYDGGGKVTLNSSGIALADTNVGISPNASVTIASTGVTLRKVNPGVGFDNTFVLTATGWQLNNPGTGGASITADLTNGLVLRDNTGTKSVRIWSGGVTIVGGVLSSPSITGGVVTAATFLLNGTTGGTVRIEPLTPFGSQVMLSIYDPSGLGNTGFFFSKSDMKFVVDSSSPASSTIGFTSFGGNVFLTGTNGPVVSLQLDAEAGTVKARHYYDGNGIKILTTQQSGPGDPAFGSLGNAQTWCQNLINALRAHGLLT